jgi:hypothetical protein
MFQHRRLLQFFLEKKLVYHNNTPLPFSISLLFEIIPASLLNFELLVAVTTATGAGEEI